MKCSGKRKGKRLSVSCEKASNAKAESATSFAGATCKHLARPWTHQALLFGSHLPQSSA